MTNNEETESIEYIDVSQIKELYGFTDAIIKKFLGDCDQTKPNPKSKTASPLKLYRLERVNQVLADTAFIEWKNKKEATSLKRKKAVSTAISEPSTPTIIKIVPEPLTSNLDLDLDLDFSGLETANWTDFDWEHFKIENDSEFYSKLLEDQKIDAVTTVKKMLSASYWFEPKAFFDTFIQEKYQILIPQIIVTDYQESILKNEWMEIPLVSLMIRDRQNQTKVILDSGHYEWIALKELFEADRLPSTFKIPVFDLKRLCLKDKYSANLDFALRYAVTGGTLGHDFARRAIARKWFTRLCTGVNDQD
jgi:hypothetical protein